MTRLLTDMDDDTTVSSLDGIGAYDHVSRACFLEELRNNADLAPLLPFVRLWYSRPSTYTWRDESGTVHNIAQAEGVEQGDPLSPLLFSLAVHLALTHAQESLREGEYLFAFLDDVYTVTPKRRATEVARLVDTRRAKVGQVSDLEQRRRAGTGGDRRTSGGRPEAGGAHLGRRC